MKRIFSFNANANKAEVIQEKRRNYKDVIEFGQAAIKKWNLYSTYRASQQKLSPDKSGNDQSR